MTPRSASWPVACCLCIFFAIFLRTMSVSVPVAGADMRFFTSDQFSARPSPPIPQLSVSRRSARRLARQGLSATASAAAAAVAEPALRYAGDAANQSAGSASPAVASESTRRAALQTRRLAGLLSVGFCVQALPSPLATGEALCNLIIGAHLHSSGRLSRKRPGEMR